MREVASVQDVIFDAQWVLGQCLKVVGSDEPLAVTRLLSGQVLLNVLLVIVCGKVQWIRGGHVVVDQRIALDDTELLFGVEGFLCLGVNVEVGEVTLLLLFDYWLDLYVFVIIFFCFLYAPICLLILLVLSCMGIGCCFIQLIITWACWSSIVFLTTLPCLLGCIGDLALCLIPYVDLAGELLHLLIELFFILLAERALSYVW